MAPARFNRPPGRDATRRGHASALAWIVLAACGHGPQHRAPETATPRATSTESTTADAARQPAPFVSPYTYEWFIRGEVFGSQGDLREAANAYRRALAGADEDPLVIARLALVLDALGEPSEAMDLLAHADTLDAESESVWMARGEIAERHGQINEAIAAYERAETCAPLSPSPIWALRRVLSDAPERAHAVMRRFAARNDHWNPHRLRMELRVALDNRELETAHRSLHRLRTTASASTREVEAVARLALDEHRPFLAREVLGEWMPRDHEPKLWLTVLLATGDLSQAEQVLATATPEQLGGLAATAKLALELGDAERAADLATLALQADPSSPTAPVLLRARGLDALAAEVEAHR